MSGKVPYRQFLHCFFVANWALWKLMNPFRTLCSLVLREPVMAFQVGTNMLTEGGRAESWLVGRRGEPMLS